MDLRIVLTDRVPLNRSDFLPEEYALALSKAGLFAWYWDRSGGTLHLSSGLIRLLPVIEHTETLNGLIRSHLTAADAERFRVWLTDCRKRGILSEQEFTVQSGDTGRHIRLEMTGVFLRSGGRLTGAVGHLRKIPEPGTGRGGGVESDPGFYRMVLDLIPAPIFYKDRGGVYRFHNKAFEAVTGPGESVTGRTVFDIAPPELAEKYDLADRQLLERGGKQVYESRVRFSDGSLHDVMFHKAVRTGPDGKPRGLAGVMMDITETRDVARKVDRLLKLKELTLQINHAILSITDFDTLLDFILSNMRNVVPKADCGSILLLDSSGFLTMVVSFGFITDPEKPFSFPMEKSFLYSEDGSPLEEPVLIDNIQEKDAEADFAEGPKTVDGRPILSTISSPILRTGKCLGILSLDSFERDTFDEEDREVMIYMQEQLGVILEKQELYRRTLDLSRFDTLTGLSNRGYFKEQAEAALNRLERNGENLILAVFDLDDLKPVNDHWGHEAGDRMIRTFAETMGTSCRSYDILGRIGGDEFAAVFFDTLREDLEEKLRKVLENAPVFPVKGGGIRCRFSFGTAVFPSDAGNYEDLFRLADGRMYAMKKLRKERRGSFRPEDLLIPGGA